MADPRDSRADALAAQVAEARASRRALAIAGGNTKAFLGEAPAEPAAQRLDLRAHRGIVSYDCGELVITARAGTPLAEIEAALAAEGQCLAFEPPHYGAAATLGGTIAAGVSGPSRPYAGAARDFVLGARIINGRGEILRFGGEVMKNVAGYDLSRLMVGAFGTLGVLLEVSLKVLPAPRFTRTQMFESDQATAIERFSAWGLRPWPITAAYWENGAAYVRLSGARSSVAAAMEALGGETLADADAFWADAREHRRTFFTRSDPPLWRLSVAPATPPLDLDGETAVDWGGAQRWLVSDAPAKTIRDAVAAHGGHASVHGNISGGGITPRQHPMPAALLRLQQRLKQSMDPAGILNRGRLCSQF
ncbi:glycolate oxidase subunit GlcE [Salinisphaera sp.]|uniref:glycolate oxidase subunit GlcE n=1 Tax=Salinisphaera sp. TaxID=1914330 RepID=UPI002D77A62B|nr:glycolate oxidase subunit GlcE [Salinisphaera sp.]HET7312801.1 glycolate oxidase subunit GlcE [Salinisphaera sp.]